MTRKHPTETRKSAQSTTESRKHPQFEKKLAAYTLAGAAVLAPGVAKAGTIDYFPNVDVIVNQTGSYSFNLSGPSSADIMVTAAADPSVFSGPFDSNDIVASTASGAEVMMTGVDDYVAALAFGTLIDPVSGTNWGSGGKMTGYDTGPGETSADAQWPTDGTDAYLGFYFESSGSLYAGWADIETTANANTSSFEVLDYAYQTTGNTTIAAGDTGEVPEPSTMAMIALGGAGLIALRRRRAKNA